MKKLILIFGAFLIIYVIVTGVAEQKTASITQSGEPQSVSEDKPEEYYTVKSENGRIVVYFGGELFYKTTTAVSTLPKTDQNELLYGIVAKDEQELKHVIEDYCS